MLYQLSSFLKKKHTRLGAFFVEPLTGIEPSESRDLNPSNPLH